MDKIEEKPVYKTVEKSAEKMRKRLSGPTLCPALSCPPPNRPDLPYQPHNNSDDTRTK